MTRTRSIYLALLAVLLSPMAANATVIYDEGVSGDLGALAGGSPLQILNVGVNTFLGTVSPDDTDDFRVQAASGLQITAGVFSVIGSGSLFYNSNGIPVAGGGIFQGYFSASGSVDILSFGVGLFRVEGQQAADFAWQYDFTVVDPNAVPEPGTLALLGLGLAGMAARRKKKV